MLPMMGMGMLLVGMMLLPMTVMMMMLPMMGMGRPMTRTPKMAQKQPSNFPKPVTGVTSPYPTCFYFNSNRFKHLAYRSHRDDRPPIGVEHVLEFRVHILLLKDKDEGGEHDGAHEEEEEEEPKLLVVGLHGVAQRL